MKFLVLFMLVGCALAHNVNRRQAPGPDATAEIRSADLAIEPDGNFNYNYETSNGISAKASGSVKELGGTPPESASVITGSYSYTSPEGKNVLVEYTADETGYHPKVTIT